MPMVVRRHGWRQGWTAPISAMSRQCKLDLVSDGIDASGTDEALAIRACLVRRGIPSDSIVVDPAGNDTWSTARNASDFMRNRGGRVRW